MLAVTVADASKDARAGGRSAEKLFLRMYPNSIAALVSFYASSSKSLSSTKTVKGPIESSPHLTAAGGEYSLNCFLK